LKSVKKTNIKCKLSLQAAAATSAAAAKSFRRCSETGICQFGKLQCAS